MKLNKIALENFRNYENLELEFDEGVNLIVGKNAQGKTNLLEGICYLGSGKSFRAQRTSEMVKFQQDFACLEGNIYSEERNQTAKWILFHNARPRQIYRNGIKKKTAADMIGLLPTVLFCPEDLQMLKGGSSLRRKFIDNVLCQLRPNYDAALNEYNKIIETKQKILKDSVDNPRIADILPDYNERLCQIGSLLISYRSRFIKALGETSQHYHDSFSSGNEELRIDYKTVSSVRDPFAPVKEIEEDIKNHLKAHERAERETCQCLTGPHKDDFILSLSDIDIKAYGSQGQTRTATISLKLAQREIMAKQFGEIPILLLDDVLSELDAGRQDFVLNQIDKGQVFITCCEPGRFTKIGKNILVDKGKIVD